MALLLARERRVPRSEFTRHYYQRPSPAPPAPPLPASPSPAAPSVPPRTPDQVVGGAYVSPPLVNPAIWRASHSAKLHDAHSATSQSQRTRAENRRVCEETDKLTTKHRDEVEHRLDERVGDLSFWREEMNKRHAIMDKDAIVLKTMADRLRKAHHLYLHPLQVAQQCIQIRRERTGVEDVEDEASSALRQEVRELERCRQALSTALADTEHQLRRVSSCRYHLDHDLQDKGKALEVEGNTRALTPSAPPTGIIPSQAIDPSPVSVEEWREGAERLAARADQEHELTLQTTSLAEDLLVACGRQLKERLSHTNHCLQARINDTRHAKTLLEHQHAKIVEEEGELEESLQEVEDQIERKRGPLALAQTRLKTRTRRPNLERTRDDVEVALLSEVTELEVTLSRLLEASDITKGQLQRLRASRVALEHDINLKGKTLLLDEVKVMSLRNTVMIDTY